MAWSDTTKRALKRWLSPDTWYKWHPIDDPRFYDFILAIWDDDQGLWDEALARETMTRVALELHPGFEDLVEKTVEGRHSEGTLILDFLCRMKERGRQIN